MSCRALPAPRHRAQATLDGKEIYDGCCQLKIIFSRNEKLNVSVNNERTFDFTNRGLPSYPHPEGPAGGQPMWGGGGYGAGAGGYGMGRGAPGYGGGAPGYGGGAPGYGGGAPGYRGMPPAAPGYGGGGGGGYGAPAAVPYGAGSRG